MKKQHYITLVLIFIGVGIGFIFSQNIFAKKSSTNSVKGQGSLHRDLLNKKDLHKKDSVEKSKKSMVLDKESLQKKDLKQISFDNDTFSAPAKDFSSFVGKWHIDKDGNNLVYAVDGRKWERGLLSEGIVSKAKGLYGDRYAEFLDNLEAYKYFPLTIFKNIKEFENGEIFVKFKGISGRIDQGAGIAFNIKKNGDYLVVRANPLENNLVLFKMERGKRSAVTWIRNVKTASKKWHDLKVVIKDKNIKGYVNGKLYLDYNYKAIISGKIGLWSKADSYVFFDDFLVK